MTTIFWGLLGLVLLVVDALTSTFLLLGYGLAGIITMAFSRVVPFYMQVIIFIVIGTLMSLYIVPKLRKTPKTKTYEESLIDTSFVATSEAKMGTKCQEKIKGTYWNIVCADEDIVVGKKFKVVKVDKENNVLIVKGEN